MLFSYLLLVMKVLENDMNLGKHQEDRFESIDRERLEDDHGLYKTMQSIEQPQRLLLGGRLRSSHLYLEDQELQHLAGE